MDVLGLFVLCLGLAVSRAAHAVRAEIVPLAGRMREFAPVSRRLGARQEQKRDPMGPFSFSLPVGPADFVIDGTLRNEIVPVNRLCDSPVQVWRRVMAAPWRRQKSRARRRGQSDREEVRPEQERT
jgi:hypothetical protein